MLILHFSVLINGVNEDDSKHCFLLTFNIYCKSFSGQVRLSATVTCNQYYLLPCGADGAR